MKGEKADYVINLNKAFLFGSKERVVKVLGVIRDFVYKHTRNKDYAISNEVNEQIHKHSKNIPHSLAVTLLKEEKRVIVFLQKGKEMDIYLKKKDAAKKKKEEKKSEKPKAAKDEKTQKDEAEEKQKAQDKKEKEDAAKAGEIKRK